MNLDLEPTLHDLVEALRKTVTTGSATAAVDAAGVAPTSAFEWCVVFEELGARTAELDLPRPGLLVCAAYAVGVGRSCLELAQERAGERVIGGRPLCEYQGPAHRFAGAAFDLATARVGLWRTAWWQDQHVADTDQERAAAAICVTAAVTCAHELVQTFGAAGTSDPDVARRYRAAYDLPALCGSPGELWRAVGR